MSKRAEGVKQLKTGIKKMILGRGTSEVELGTKGVQVKSKKTGADVLNRLSGMKDIAVGAAKAVFNHDEWWNHYSDAMGNLVNANLGTRKGVPLKGYVYRDSDTRGVPSVASCLVCLSIPNTNSNPGISTDPNNDTWMTAVGKIYNSIRRANSGSVNYDVEALSKYIMATRSIVAVLAELDRACALLRTYDIYDATVPAAYFAGSGFDYDTFRANSANLANYVELLKIRLHALMPLDIDLYKYTYWMFSNVFKDSDDAKASEYMFDLHTGYSFYTTTYDLDTLRTVNIHGSVSATATGAPYATVIAAVDQLVADFVNSNTFNVIAGDILKAFGTNAFTRIEMYKQNDTVRKVYDEKILTKIQNTTVFSTHGFSTQYPYCVVTSSGHFTTRYRTQRSTLGGSYDITKMLDPIASKPFINSYKDNNSMVDLVSMTRFCNPFGATYSISSTADTNCIDISFGTEIIERVGVFFVQDTSSNKYLFERVNLGHIIYQSGNNNPSDAITMWTTLDYAPWTCAYEPTFGNLGQMFDFNNFGRVDKEWMDNVNDIATYSILYVPELARVSKSDLF